jgi:hypothetical protein
LIWDGEAQVWIAENDEIPIVLNSASLDKLIKRVQIATPELLEMNGKTYDDVKLNFRADKIAVIA